MECHGVPETVIVNGKVAFEDGKLNVTAGSGRFLHRKPNIGYVYDRTI